MSVADQAALTSVHGVMMRVGGIGVLLAGPAGSGKSQFALELLTRGHQLVADDCVDCALTPDGRLMTRSPAFSQGFLQVRGLGVINVPKLFGAAALCQSVELQLQVCLAEAQEASEVELLEGCRRQERLCGVELPRRTLDLARSSCPAAWLEAACLDEGLRREGYDAVQDFIARQQGAIRSSS